MACYRMALYDLIVLLILIFSLAAGISFIYAGYWGYKVWLKIGKQPAWRRRTIAMFTTGFALTGFVLLTLIKNDVIAILGLIVTAALLVLGIVLAETNKEYYQQFQDGAQNGGRS